MTIVISGDGRVNFEEFMKLQKQIAEEREKQLTPYRERAEALGMTLEELENMAIMSGRSIETYLEAMESLIKPTPQLTSLADFIEVLEENDEGLSAAEIRKQLKYEKNPMRIKQLNKMLNGASKKVRKKKVK